MTKLGAGGIYLFNLVGYDYADADVKLKKSVATLLARHGEHKICQIAEQYVDTIPDATLGGLLKHLSSKAKHLRVHPEPEVEGEYY